MALVATDHFGVYHLVNEGEASRYEFAQAVLQATDRAQIALTPIRHTDWSRVADSPLHAVLVNQAAAALGIQLRPWRAALDDYIRCNN
jgi:dTDP-4-dehydrorhamnose reductase